MADQQTDQRNNQQQAPDAARGGEIKPADEKSFGEISGHAVFLSLHRLKTILAEKENTKEFDCGARSARTLMAIAKDADGLRQQHEKERLAHEDTAEEKFTVSDDRIREKKREIAGRLARIEYEDRLREEGEPLSGAMDQGERA